MHPQWGSLIRSIVPLANRRENQRLFGTRASRKPTSNGRYCHFPRARHCVRWMFAIVGSALVVVASSHAAAEPSPSKGREQPPVTDAQLRELLDRRIVQRAALQRNPAVRVSEQRASAMRTAAKAEGTLPSPELMGQVWQVPFSRPTAFDSQMVMFGVTQSFPAPGVLAAKEQSAAAQASEELAMAQDKARMIVREAGRAFTDYLESFQRYRVQSAQLAAAKHIVAVAEARHSAAGPLIDLTRAQVDLARVQADVLAEATILAGTKARLNALLAREPLAPMGDPSEPETMVAAWDLATLLAKAKEIRPELKQAQAQLETREYAARAAEREATWPSFAAGALYFPPTTAMPHHGYGVSLSVSMPWLWGAAGHRREAENQWLGAARTNSEAAGIPINADVVTAEAATRISAVRLQVLRDRALPASQRSFEVARAGFESGRIELTAVLDARRAVFEIEREAIAARADLERALTDLEAAVGAEVPLRPLGTLDPHQLEGGSGEP